MLRKWLAAGKSVLLTYITVHLALFVLTVFASLFTISDFSTQVLPLHTLWQSWARWDTGHYGSIATRGYDGAWRTAFFPFFPMLIHAVAFIVHDPLVAGLTVSAIANLFTLIALYQVVEKDFGRDVANRTVLYLSVFPSAFFFAAAYTESLFVCLIVLSFYQIRNRRWLTAGIVGFFACLTRSTGIFLLLPYMYEYLRQHDWRGVRTDVLFGFFVPSGLLVYSLYCFVQFGDALSWVHAQSVWHHRFSLPWDTLFQCLKGIKESGGLLSFQALHNCLDLMSVLFVVIACALLLVGPWKMNKQYFSYVVYALPLTLFVLCSPVVSTPLVPLQSMPRYMLEVFPVFLLAGRIGVNPHVHHAYLLISVSLLYVSCLLFLTGHWMV